MKANELRIGNWVLDEDWREMQIEHLQPIFNYAFRWEWLKYLKPIPLTEEWLLRFGAQERKVSGSCSSFVFEFDNIQLDWDNESGLVMFIIGSHESILFENIKYVHQLQNLYFALTGEELKLHE